MKYYYNGVTLSKYCRINRINYMVIQQRVYRLQKRNPKLSNDEAVRLIMEDNVNGNAKYMYEGMLLREYCQKNNMSYEYKVRRICSLKRLNPELSDDEAVRLIMEDNVNGNAKYIYEGLSLREYCQKNNMNYDYRHQKILNLKKQNPKLSDDEAVRLIMEDNVHGNVKYMHQGMSLKEYCQENNMSYDSKLQKINSLKKLNPKLSDDEIIKLVMGDNVNGNVKYMYEGLSLAEYCLKNALNYNTIFVRISRLKKKNQEIAINELVKIAVESQFKENIKYMYEGVSLMEYCKNNHINYDTVLYRLHKFETDYYDLPTEKLIELSLKLKK